MKIDISRETKTVEVVEGNKVVTVKLLSQRIKEVK